MVERPQGGIRVHGRSVDPDPLAFQQAMPSNQRQHPAEHRFVDLLR
jgi:hypothetical protein